MPRSRSSSSTDGTLLEVGRVDRPHGIRGEVAVSLVTNRLERLDPGSVLQSDDGPLVVISSRPHGNRHLVRFEDVVTRDQAEQLKGLVLKATPIVDPDELWVHELIGLTVVDQDDIDRGVITGVIDNPASDLLELDDGSLVPARFVVGRTPSGAVEVDAPPGLFVGDGHTDEIDR